MKLTPRKHKQFTVSFLSVRADERKVLIFLCTLQLEEMESSTWALPVSPHSAFLLWPLTPFGCPALELPAPSSSELRCFVNIGKIKESTVACSVAANAHILIIFLPGNHQILQGFSQIWYAFTFGCMNDH